MLISSNPMLVGRPLYSELFKVFKVALFLQEAELQGATSDLQSQLEAEKQHSELAKVSETQRKVRPSLTANAASLCSPQVEVSELTGKLLAMQQQVHTIACHPQGQLVEAFLKNIRERERERERESRKEGAGRREQRGREEGGWEGQGAFLIVDYHGSLLSRTRLWRPSREPSELLSSRWCQCRVSSAQHRQHSQSPGRSTRTTR